MILHHLCKFLSVYLYTIDNVCNLRISTHGKRMQIADTVHGEGADTLWNLSLRLIFTCEADHVYSITTRTSFAGAFKQQQTDRYTFPSSMLMLN